MSNSVAQRLKCTKFHRYKNKNLTGIFFDLSKEYDEVTTKSFFLN
jgi:hypothetical protein